MDQQRWVHSCGPGRWAVMVVVAVLLGGAGAVGAGTVVQVNTNWDTELAAADPTFQPLRFEMRDNQEGDPILTVNNFLSYLFNGDYNNTLFHRWVDGFVAQGGGFAMNYAQYPSDFLTIASDPYPLRDWGYYPDPGTGQPTVGWADPNYFAQNNLLNYDPTGENQNYEAWYFRNIALNAIEVPAASPIVNQFNPQTMTNTVGTIAMAKHDGNPDSATNEYFVNLGDNSDNLDNQNGGFTVFADVVDDPAQFTGMQLFQWFSDHLFGIVNLSPDGYFTDGSASLYGNFDGYRDTSPLNQAPILAMRNEQNEILRLAPLVVTSMDILSGSTFNPLPGDFNTDGGIDQTDLTLLLANWAAASVPAQWTGPFDGLVDQNELNDLLAQWGIGMLNAADPLNLAPTAATVPEPATMGLLLLGGVVTLRRRKSFPGDVNRLQSAAPLRSCARACSHRRSEAIPARD